MIFVTSDIHLNPGDKLPGFLIALFQEAEETGARVIINGDLFNFLPYGIKKWHEEGDYTIDQFLLHLPKQGCDVIYGNHEGRYEWLRDEFAHCPEIRVAKELNIFIGDKTWHFEHGHRFALEWSWLQWIADDITQFMIRFFPKQWYWICKKLGWMPSQYKGIKPAQYDKMAWTVWRNGLNWAVKNKQNLVIGHTHSKAWTVLDVGVSMIDTGCEQVTRI